eukprot:scaffold29501_cov100-Isochrysis_galbana.AAC.6
MEAISYSWCTAGELGGRRAAEPGSPATTRAYVMLEPSIRAATSPAAHQSARQRLAVGHLPTPNDTSCFAGGPYQGNSAAGQTRLHNRSPEKRAKPSGMNILVMEAISCRRSSADERPGPPSFAIHIHAVQEI